MSRACRDAANAFAAIDARAARCAHAQATHDTAHTLVRNSEDSSQAEVVAAALVKWCRISDAATALKERVVNGLSAADAWRACARILVKTAAMPTRIRLARRKLSMYQAEDCIALLTGRQAPSHEDEDALTELAEQDEEAWHARLVEMLQGAPS